MIIREMKWDDIPPLVDLGARMHAESPDLAAFPYAPEAATQFLSHIVDAPTQLCLVAEKAPGEIVGFFYGMVTQHYFSKELYAIDFALYVCREVRHTPAGGRAAVALLKRYVAWARDHGAAEIQLGITTGIHPERTGRFYQRMGFRPAGTLYTMKG
ncbi:MAG: GNAT family N-acetyltransferase [Magnetococcales bacterium]|nr:GNAT family N-acetyltransferase [Magnetococcales bacterium]